MNFEDALRLAPCALRITRPYIRVPRKQVNTPWKITTAFKGSSSGCWLHSFELPGPLYQVLQQLLHQVFGCVIL